MKQLMTIGEAAQAAPGRPSAAAVWRWARKGIVARNDERVRLRHVRVGRRIFIAPDALDDFFAAVAEADAKGLAPRGGSKPLGANPRSERDREAAIARARQELEEAN